MMDSKTIKEKLRGLTLEQIKLLRIIIDDEIRSKESENHVEQG
jgi:hypothetical protein